MHLDEHRELTVFLGDVSKKRKLNFSGKTELHDQEGLMRCLYWKGLQSLMQLLWHKLSHYPKPILPATPCWLQLIQFEIQTLWSLNLDLGYPLMMWVLLNSPQLFFLHTTPAHVPRHTWSTMCTRINVHQLPDGGKKNSMSPNLDGTHTLYWYIRHIQCLTPSASLIFVNKCSLFPTGWDRGSKSPGKLSKVEKKSKNNTCLEPSTGYW